MTSAATAGPTCTAIWHVWPVMGDRPLSPENEAFVQRVIQVIHLNKLQDEGVVPFTLLPDSLVSIETEVDNVCDWYYAAPEDRPRVCPTCGEEFE